VSSESASAARPRAGQDRISVRPAGPADWRTVRQVRLAALADSPEAFASTLELEHGIGDDEWHRRMETAAWFLAWQDADPVGLVAAVTRPAAGGGTEWHILSMWASPRARGRGAADLLVRAVAGHVRAAGENRVTLWVADGNARARGFYRRLGFRATGARQTYQRQDGSEFDERELALEL
jgi:ribosomal protein S18 acetylase RimI-like enzyme